MSLEMKQIFQKFKKKLANTFLFVQLFLYFTPIISDDVEYKLVHSLLAKYDKDIRPTVDYKKSINVTFGLSLTQIIDVVSNTLIQIIFIQIIIKYNFGKDERNMIITTNCWLTQVCMN